MKGNMLVANSFQLGKYIAEKEKIRTENHKPASQMFRNKDDEIENTQLDVLLTEQKEMLADRSNQKWVK